MVSAAEASRSSLPMRRNVLSASASVDSSRTSVAAIAIEKTPTAALVENAARAMRPMRSLSSCTTRKPESVSPYVTTRR